MVHLISFTLCWLMNFFQRSVGMTPTFQKLAPRKCQAPETPWSSGRLPDKHQCQTDVDAIFVMSKAVSRSFSGGSDPAILPSASPEQMTKAIWLVEEEEGQGGSNVLMKAADLFHSDPRNPIAYLAFSKEMRSTWLHHELDQVAQNAAILDFSMLPVDNSF